MATNIGTITFSVTADTKGLQKANAQVKAFEQANTRLARQQTKDARAAVAARNRQEKAIRQALEATINLRREQQKANVLPGELAKTTQAYKRLTNAITKGTLTQQQLQRHVDTFTATINRVRRETDNWRKSQEAASKSGSKWLILMRDLESSAVFALGPLSGLGARIRSLSAIFSRSSLKMAAWVAGTAGVVIALAKIAAGAVRAGATMKSLELRFNAALGGTEGPKALRFVTRLTQQLGLELEATAKSYARFTAATQGTQFEGEKTQRIFTNMARAAAALKLSGSEAEGVFRAIEQIMSKGQIQMEELRGQLGDRLPGAIRHMATTLGVTTSELNRMVKAGEVGADVMLRFSEVVNERIGSTAEQNVNTLAGAWNVLQTNMTLWLKDVDDVTNASDVAIWTVQQFADSFAIMAGEARIGQKTLDEMGFTVEGVGKIMRANTPRTLEFSFAFQKLQETVRDSIWELNDMEGILRRVREGANADDAEAYFKAFRKFTNATTDDLIFFAETLSLRLGMQVEPTLNGVAKAFEEMARRMRVMKEEATKLPDVMDRIANATKRAQERIQALEAGPEAQKTFDKVTNGIKALDDALKDLGKSEQERLRILAPLIAALERQAQLEAANKEATKKAAEEERKRKTALRGLATAQAKVAQAQEKLRTMKLDPDAAEEFEKVTKPLMAMEESLRKAGVSGAEAKKVLTEYEQALRGMLSLTDRIARANAQMADAMVNGVERMILEGASLKSVLHDLAKELLAVAIRALFLDKLRFTLFSIFSGGGFPGIATAGAGVGGGGGPVTPAGGGLYATGGSFKLTGSGGSDKIPFFGVGRAGETVTVSRPSQGGGMGGGINIVQNNNFEGVQGAQELIPILEANNRRLKADILANMDRRTL